ncbi:MAG: RidA family protein [Candidatus Sericytochromatia bacterium]
MEKKEEQSNKVFSQKAPEPVGAYAHARKQGNLLFLAGIGPRKKGSKEIPGVTLDENGKISSYDIEVQTRSVIENVKTVLEDSGSSFDKILDVQVFLTDMDKDFKKFIEVYKEYFSETLPTRTTVCINSLPTPIAVEFKVIAEV